MNIIYLYTFISVFIISLISLLGVLTLSLRTETLKKYIFIFISVAVGAMLGDAFIHLIPEALEESTNGLLTSILIVVGILMFFILEKTLHWHHHGEDLEENHVHPVGKLILVSDFIHNFLDGIIVATSFMVSVPVGIATTIAVVLHEIPQEIGDFAVLLHAGYTKKKALFLNFLSALSAVLGALVFFTVEEILDISLLWLLPIAAGGFIYIAMTDLIPELHKNKEAKHSTIQIISIVVGILAMLALTLLE